MPVIFVGHGSPLTAFEDNPITRAWTALGRRIGKPRAVLVISAHWETKGVLITAAERPRTIHDFYGFPQALYDYTYDAPGDPALARDLQARLSAFGARADLDGWGLDHGSWSVLKFLFPDADVPVLQLSMDIRRTPEQHYAIGQALAGLRDEGVLILASGNIVHNLRLYNPRQPSPAWAERFDTAIVEQIGTANDAGIVNYLGLGEDARLAAPESEHFLPLIYALGARDQGESVEIFNRQLSSSLSMTSVAFGMPEPV